MKTTVRGRQLLVGCAAIGVAAALSFAGAIATAEPVLPLPPNPGYPPVAPPAASQIVTGIPHGAGVGAAANPSAMPVAVPAPGSTFGPGVGPVTGTAPTAPVTRAPASSGTLHDYLAGKGVQLEAQQPATFTALNITLPVPTGWTQVPDPNVPDAFAVIAARQSGALYTPNAQVVVYRLIGDVDPGEAITHGFVDSQQLFAWQTTNASLADFDGFPSSLIEGTYREPDMTLNTSRRHVIARAGAANYLVSLTVTTGVGESVGHAPATDAIINGFRVHAPGAVPAAPAPAAVSAPVAPGFSPLPPLTAQVSGRAQ